MTGPTGRRSCRLRLGVQHCDASAEGRIIGKVEVVQPAGNCGAWQLIGIVAIGMKRPRRIDDDVMACKQMQIFLPVHLHGRAAQLLGPPLRLLRVAPGHCNLMPVTDQQAGEALAEDPIATKDQNLHRKSLF